jgi:hypothetical protein
MFADLLQVVLIGATALVAGLGLVRPAVGRLSPSQRTVARWAAGIAGVAAVPVALFDTMKALMMAGHIAVILVVLAVLHRRTPAFLAGAVLTALLGVEMSIVDDLVDPVYVASGVVLLGVGVIVAMADDGTRAAQARRLVSVAITALVVALGFGFSQVPTSAPHHHTSSPESGVLLWEAHLSGAHVPVLLTPQRPGRNLVLVGGAADGVRVGTELARMAPVRERAGADGKWAIVDLPPGLSTLWIEHGGDRLSVPVDTGHGEPATPAVVGADGPECASAALGAVLRGGSHTLAACPADSLSFADETSLRGLVDFLAARGVRTITVAADGSARSAAAVHAVHDAASRNRLSISVDAGPEGALVVVSGWEAASTTLGAVAVRQRAGVAYGAGTYLAPWLLSASVIRPIGGAIIPLRFNPRDEQPVSYKLALASRFHGLSPTASGYRGWLSTQADTEVDTTQLYAASFVSFLPRALGSHEHHSHGDWLPGGTVVAVGGPVGKG